MYFALTKSDWWVDRKATDIVVMVFWVFEINIFFYNICYTYLPLYEIKRKRPVNKNVILQEWSPPAMLQAVKDTHYE